MNSDSTLHLPRILCLHGGGTNARIFRMQCRVLERRLRPHFRFVYAEAPIPARPGPDVVAAYKDCGPFKAWLRVRPDDPAHDASQILEGIEDSLSTARQIDNYRGATGKWVGLLGFSQGAHLAASILANQQVLGFGLENRNGTELEPMYRFAILLAGRGPLRWLHSDLPMPDVGFIDAAECTTGQAVEAMLSSVQYRLRAPTVHVHGMTDPGLDLHRRLLHEHCDRRSATLVEWDGDHRVPIKTKDVNPVVQQILSVAQQTGVTGSITW